MKNKRLIAMVMLILALSMGLIACGSSEEVSTNIAESGEVVAENVEEKVQAGEVVEETKSVTEETAEDATQEEQKTEGPQDVVEWAQLVYKGEPKLTIWNDVTKEGIILDKEQNHILKKDEQVILCYDIENSQVYSVETIEYKTTAQFNSLIFEFTEEPLNDSLFQIYVRANGTEYELSAILTEEGNEGLIAEEQPIEELSGRDWTKTLEYEEPKLIAWNDETGTKEVIEPNGEYTMQDGDVLGIYYPTDYLVFNALPAEFVKEIVFMEKVSVIEYILPNESQVIDLEVEVLNPQKELDNYYFTMTTP